MPIASLPSDSTIMRLRLQVGPLLVQLLALESPRWLVAKGRLKEAVRVVNVINEANGKDTVDEKEFRELVSECLVDSAVFKATVAVFVL